MELRRRVVLYENEVSSCDVMIILINNYYWLDADSRVGFLANGALIELLRIEHYESLYGFQVANVTGRLIDYPNEKDLQIKIILDSLSADGPELAPTDSQRLFDEVMKDYEDIPSRRKRLELLKKNPYFNAVQVKFGYALTCHKTQGGQWDTVFIDWGYITEQHANKAFYRWLYTAITRATKNLFLVNFPEAIFK